MPRDGTDGRKPNLFFSTDVDAAIKAADLIFISVNTPTKTVGHGAGKASDLAYVESAARRIAEVATSDTIIVEKSTVPCGTAEHLREIFASLAQPGLRFDVLSNPEFLAEGTAMSDLAAPERILIGSLKSTRALEAGQALADVYAAWVPRVRIKTMNLWSSELSKLAANCMLAQRISSINSLSALCESTGADINELATAVGLDSRIGPKMLKASAGFGGSCFKKDVLSLVYIAESHNLPEVASYWRGVVDINEYQKDRFMKRITKALYNTLSQKKIAVLGFAYKKDTGDTRESAAISVVGQMIAENARVAIYDPKVDRETIIRDLERDHTPQAVARCVTVCSEPYEACERAAAIVVLTEWDFFRTDELPDVKALSRQPSDLSSGDSTPSSTSASGSDEEPEAANDALSTPLSTSDSAVALPIASTPRPKQTGARIDWARVANTMRRPRLLFDGRNIVEPPKLVALGFQVHCIGRKTNRR